MKRRNIVLIAGWLPIRYSVDQRFARGELTESSYYDSAGRVHYLTISVNWSIVSPGATVTQEVRDEFMETVEPQARWLGRAETSLPEEKCRESARRRGAESTGS